MEPRHKFVLAIACLFLAILIIANANAMNVGVGTHFSPSGLNTQYTVNATLTLTSIRVESTALYFDGNILKHTPDAGSITVYLDIYNPPNDIKYMINTTGATTEVNHTIGGLNATEKYSILVDDTFWKAQSTDAAGILMFNHSASNHTFEITKSANVDCNQSIFNYNGNVVSYNWGNWSANPGDTNVGKYSDANQTFIKATNNGSADGTATISWSYGTLNNTTTGKTIAIDNNIKYVYGTGTTPSAVSSWTYSAVDTDHSFQVTVPASSTLWLYYEIQNIGAVPSGTYTQSFTWTAT